MLARIKESKEKPDMSLLRLAKVHSIKNNVKWWVFVVAIFLIAGSEAITAL